MALAQKKNARGGRAFSIVVHVGLVGSSTYSRGDFGGLIKRPREFLNSFLSQRTTIVSELVIAIGLPALMTRAVCV
jgi:hypothetical protein